MARRRFQNGSVVLVGKKWIGRYREDERDLDGNVRRIKKAVVLGTKKELPTKPLAMRRLADQLVRINAPAYRPGCVATVEQFADRWEREVLSKQKPSSVRAVKSHLRCYIRPFLGKFNLDQLGVENQQAFVTRVSENGVSRKTVLNVIGTLSSMLSTAKDWSYICEPVDTGKLALPRRGLKLEARNFTKVQVQGILAAAKNPWRTMFYIVTLTAFRAGEVLGLKWSDVDFDRKIIKVSRTAWYGNIDTAKSEASETALPVPDLLLGVLKAYRLEWKPNPGEFLFVTRNNRPPSSNKVVQYQLWPILDSLGIPRCGLHALRHTHTSLLLDSGASPKVAQRQLRHSDARTTLEIYGHVVEDAQRQAVEKVAASLDSIGLNSPPGSQTIQ